MVANGGVDPLRSEVDRLRRAATRKISRLKTQNGALVSGTKFDPRRAPKQHAKYTVRQLETYKEALQGFLSRGTQFVGDSHGRPIAKGTWMRYVQAEKRFARQVEDRFGGVKDLKTSHGETLGERMAKMTPDHPTLSGAESRQFYRPAKRGPGNVKDERALEKLTRDLERKSDPNFFDKLTKRARGQFDAMADTVNEPKFKELASQLSDSQFAAAWHYGGLPNALGLSYEIMQKMLSDKEKPWHSKILADSMGEAYAILRRAKEWQI